MFDMIFKRKSFRRFDDSLKITAHELAEIETKLKSLECLTHECAIKYNIVKREETTCKRGEYCLLIYGEKTPQNLVNIGYTFEQLDLWMASQNIGACWYGMGKIGEPSYEGLEYIIMIAFGKAHPEEFRKDYTKAKRKDIDTIWLGQYWRDVADIVRYSPSACNTQPWRITSMPDLLKIERNTIIKSIMPKNKTAFYNSIDMGIFLYILELVLKSKGYSFRREFEINANQNSEFVGVATYHLHQT